jgi:hypothetical protein
MSEKIYCKDCRFYENGLCHRVPPQVIFVGEGARENSFPRSAPDCWCGMAEKKPDATYQARPANENFVLISENGNKETRINDIPLGTFITNLQGKANDLEAENNRLRGLITEIRDLFDWRGQYRGTSPLKSECLMVIYAIANEEDEKRRAGK